MAAARTGAADRVSRRAAGVTVSRGCDSHGMVTSLARSVAVGDDQTMWQAIILVLLIAGAIRLTWKRPNTGGRLAVIGAGALLFWGAVALIDPGTAGKMAEWTALGFVTTIRGAASLIGDL